MRTSLVATLVLLVACEKKPAPPPAPSPAVSTTTVASPAITPSTPAPAPDEPMPNATAASSAPAATALPPAVAPAPSVVASAAPVASSAPAPSASGPKTFACGGAGLPKCPLQKWMAEVMQPAMKGNDPAKLTAALEQSAKYGPPGYTDWNKWVKAGVAALAKDKNVAAAKPSCTGCHTDYKQRYKAEDRDRPL